MTIMLLIMDGFNMPSFFRTTLNDALQKFGYELNKIQNDNFGIKWLNDVRRLSNAYSKNINVAFDVGANVGSAAKEMLECFDSSCVYAFECHPITFKKLLSNTVGTRSFF